LTFDTAPHGVLPDNGIGSIIPTDRLSRRWRNAMRRSAHRPYTRCWNDSQDQRSTNVLPMFYPTRPHDSLILIAIGRSAPASAVGMRASWERTGWMVFFSMSVRLRGLVASAGQRSSPGLLASPTGLSPTPGVRQSLSPDPAACKSRWSGWGGSPGPSPPRSRHPGAVEESGGGRIWFPARPSADIASRGSSR